MLIKAGHIKYDYRIINLNPGRNKRGSFGVNNKFGTEYYIYVSKNDYENAAYLLGKEGRHSGSGSN